MIKKIKGFQNYEIDTNGNVWSFLIQKRKKGWKTGFKRQKTKNKHKLKGSLFNTGYLYVHLCKGDSRFYSQKTIHRLVAETFISNPKNNPIVCHKNGIKTDNRVINLYWGTQKENLSDMVKHGRSLRGEKNFKAKLTQKQIEKIKKMYKTNKYTQVELGRLFKVSNSTIHDIVKKRNWKHVK